MDDLRPSYRLGAGELLLDMRGMRLPAGSVTPLRTTETAQNNVCREFQQTITVGGETRQGYGTACRQPDGSWRIVR